MPTIRAHLQDIPPYTPIEPYDVLSARYGIAAEKLIKLDANENPYGIPEPVKAVLANLQDAHIYPDPESRQLRHALSQYSGVPFENLLAGSGADELLDLILRLTLEPGESIINCPPTFGMYAFDTRINGGVVIDVPRRADFSIDIETISNITRKHAPKLIFIAAPNNPDGSLLDDRDLRALLDLPLLVVLDEAYVEFTGSAPFRDMATRISLVKQRENLIVLRSFSKWAGLAGLRVGFGAFPDWIMPHLWNCKQPYNVNVAASQAAISALANLEAYHPSLLAIQQERDILRQALDQLPYLATYPSQANFILCKVIGLSAEILKRRLATEFGIFIRYFDSPGLRDHIRISVGKPEHTRLLIEALEAVYQDRNENA